MKSLISFYRSLSPLVAHAVYAIGFIAPQCKFQPTCSEFAHLAIEKHGAIKGSYKSVLRILRCNFLHSPGVDLP